MSTSFATQPCQVCAAPCRPGHEYTTHEAACLTLVVGNTRPKTPTLSPDALGEYCARIHAEDQAKAHLRENTQPVPPPPAADTPADPRRKMQDWYQQHRGGGQTFPVPEGKTLCAYCNGLTHMHPNCHNCNGRGWVD